MKGTYIAKALSTITVLVMLVALASPAMAQEEEFFYQRNITERYTVEKAEITSAVVTPQSLSRSFRQPDRNGTASRTGWLRHRL